MLGLLGSRRIFGAVGATKTAAFETGFCFHLPKPFYSQTRLVQRHKTRNKRRCMKDGVHFEIGVKEMKAVLENQLLAQPTLQVFESR